jgi:hypothetical protein
MSRNSPFIERYMTGHSKEMHPVSVGKDTNGNYHWIHYAGFGDVGHLMLSQNDAAELKTLIRKGIMLVTDQITEIPVYIRDNKAGVIKLKELKLVSEILDDVTGISIGMGADLTADELLELMRN